jgi:methyltransferase
MLPIFLLLVAFLPMLAEARRASRNATLLERLGAHDPEGDPYALMQFAYPACFLAVAGEAWVRGASMDSAFFIAGLVVFAAAKGVKYWAIATLGDRWTFRVLVPPGSSRILAGPYRFMRHPNYVGVIGELIGMALMGQAPVAGAGSILGFGALIRARIRVEERALRLDAE